MEQELVEKVSDLAIRVESIGRMIAALSLMLTISLILIYRAIERINKK